MDQVRADQALLDREQRERTVVYRPTTPAVGQGPNSGRIFDRPTKINGLYYWGGEQIYKTRSPNQYFYYRNGVPVYLPDYIIEHLQAFQ